MGWSRLAINRIDVANGANRLGCNGGSRGIGAADGLNVDGGWFIQATKGRLQPDE